MKKIIITSLIMKKAHQNTKKMKLEFPEINYKTQLGLEISKLLKEEKINWDKRIVIIKLSNKIKEVINHEFYLGGQDITKVENMLIQNTRLKRLYFPSAMTHWDLANYLVKEHYEKVRCI